MSKFSFINKLIEKKYIVYNVNSNKMPSLGNNDDGWSKITFDNTLKYHNYDSDKFGLRTGIQENGDYIIGLDFDMWYKSQGKYIASENTRKLYEEFNNINKNNYGVFSSSTELNRGVLVNINKSKKIQDILSINGKRKIEKKDYHLEILANFNMVLPPTSTKCKIRGTETDKRTFLSEEPILEIEKNTDLENFIYNYINDSTIIKDVNKTDLRNKESKEIYLKYTEKTEKNDILINDSELLKPFIDKLDIERVKNYNEWYKIGYSIKNTYGDNGLNLFKYFSMKDNYIDSNIEKIYNSWSSNKYEKLNSNYIINCVKIDNPEIFIRLLIQYEKNIDEIQYKKQKENFEKVVKKILEPSIWIKKNRINNEWGYTNWNDILHIYSEVKGFGKNFLNEYLTDDNKNYFDTVDFIPEHNFIEEKEDIKTFNMFKGFEIQKYTPNNIIDKKDIYIKVFEDHLKNLTNNEENSYNFLLQWIAHLIIKPNKRSKICVVLQGIPGTGKTTLYELINSIMGSGFCYSTARPENTIFDRFNSCLKDKILVNINEPDFNSFKSGFEEFKSLITDNKFCLEDKGMPKLELSNYMSFIITTNNEKLFTLSADDRRFYFIKTNDKIAGNGEYFDNLFDCLNNKDFQYTIFNYLKEIIDESYNFTHIQKNQKTEFHQLLVDSGTNPFYQFIQDFIEDNNNDNYIVDNDKYIIQPKEFIDLYKKYCKDNDINKMDNGISIKMKMKKINTNIYKKHDNKWNYIFNQEEVKNHLIYNKLYTE